MAGFEVITALLCFLLVQGAVAPGEGESSTHYLLYSVNPGEGFNLRRDVYMRAATLVKSLRSEGENWALVLPPWPHLYHWRSSKVQQSNIKWERFFDLPSLREYVPVIEFDDYIKQEGTSLKEVLWLQQFTGGWDKFEEKAETTPCSDHTPYSQTSSGTWKGRVFGLHEMTTDKFRCVSILGFTKTLIPHIKGKRSIMVEHFEVVMHDNFGGLEYWKARSSMVYAKPLREVGSHFMRSSLGYEVEGGGAGGGDYMAVHLRRQDYTRVRPGDIPSLLGAAKQINSSKKLHNLETVFLATDAPLKERQVLAYLVEGVVWFTPTDDELHLHGDGGMAIIDQWIASHAKFFTGSFESTFSFRIREDRQLLGFSMESTFNHLCGSKDDQTDHTSCAPPTYWEVPQEVLDAATRKRRLERNRTEL